MANRHIRLRLLDEFSCVGSACSASCCSQGWNINVDAETHTKWLKADAECKELGLLESLVKKQGSEEIYLRHVDHRCTHLSDDGLCKIQIKFGHEYIPETCRVYPRRSWSVSRFSSETLNLSCPEVLNHLLKETNENLFDIGKKPKKNNIDKSNPTIPDEFASLLDEYISQVMRNNTFPVAIQVVTITKKLIDVVLLSQQRMLGIPDLQKELKGVSQQLKATQNIIEQNQVLGSIEDNGRFWSLVFFMGKIADSLPSSIDKYHDKIIDLIESSDKSSTSFEDIGGMIRNYRTSFYNRLPGFYRDFMCRYLRVKFLNNAFPWRPVEGNLIAGLLYCILPFALIQLYVWILAENNDRLTEQDIIEIIYSVERKLDHNDKIYKFLSEHPELLRLDTYYICLADV